MNKPVKLVLFLLSQAAWAQAAVPAPDAGKNLLLQLPIFLALFALFYFGLIRPQKAQQAKHLEFVQSLSRGDEIVSASGIIGTVTGLTDKVVTLEIAPGTEIKLLRSQVQGRLKDTIA